eukprot:6180035-Pleurochrysis_carterae.AAC.1
MWSTQSKRKLFLRGRKLLKRWQQEKFNSRHTVRAAAWNGSQPPAKRLGARAVAKVAHEERHVLCRARDEASPRTRRQSSSENSDQGQALGGLE